MAFNVNKLRAMARPLNSEELRLREEWRKNREWVTRSQEIALAVHYLMDKEHLKQCELAERMGVSAAYVGRLLRGGENLTLETICKLERAIGERLITVEEPYIKEEVADLTAVYDLQPQSYTSDTYKERQHAGTEFSRGAYMAA